MCNTLKAMVWFFSDLNCRINYYGIVIEKLNANLNQNNNNNKCSCFVMLIKHCDIISKGVCITIESIYLFRFVNGKCLLRSAFTSLSHVVGSCCLFNVYRFVFQSKREKTNVLSSHSFLFLYFNRYKPKRNEKIGFYLFIISNSI